MIGNKETEMTKQKTSPPPRVVYVTFAMTISKYCAYVDEVVAEVEQGSHYITASHPAIMGTELVKIECDEF